MNMTGLPLNGTKTHPLRKASLDVLAALESGPMPRHVVNPGVVDRLTREDPPHAELKGLWLYITVTGRAELARRKANAPKGFL